MKPPAAPPGFPGLLVLPPPAPPAYESGKVVLGILLSLSGAVLLGFSMVLQRYALSYPRPIVPLLKMKLRRNVVWVIGLVVYGAANGLNAAAQQMAPLSLLSAVFTLMIVFNMIFARIFLREELTPPKVVGSCIILLGVFIALSGTPASVPTQFTAEVRPPHALAHPLAYSSPCPRPSTDALRCPSAQQIEDLVFSPGGAAYLILLFSLVFASVVAIIVYERTYAAAPLAAAAPVTSVQAREVPLDSACVMAAAFARDVSGELATAAAADAAAQESHPPAPGAAPSVMAVTAAAAPAEEALDEAVAPEAAAAAEDARRKKPLPPPWLDRAMLLVYPGSLGLDEAINGACIKGGEPPREPSHSRRSWPP